MLRPSKDDDDDRKMTLPPRRSSSDHWTNDEEKREQEETVSTQPKDPSSTVSAAAPLTDADGSTSLTAGSSSPRRYAAEIRKNQGQKRYHEIKRSGKEGKGMIGKGVITTAANERSITASAPGAVREGGLQHHHQGMVSKSDSDSVDNDDDDLLQPDTAIVITAELANVAEAEVVHGRQVMMGNNRNLEQQRQLRTEEIVKRVVQELNENKNTDEPAKRKWSVRMIGAIVAVVVVVILVVVIVVVVLTRRKSSSSSPASSTTPKSISSSMPITQSPTPVPVNPCKDFPCSSTLSVMDLVLNASNHTLLAEYLSREYNSDLYAFLASSQSNVTLFAPTDESFKNLPLPFLLYDISAYDVHLYYLLAAHILNRAESFSQIFETTTLNTYLPNTDPLSVNAINKTIQNGASIVTPDIQASNGYIHVPDRVFLPPYLTVNLFEALLRTDLATSVAVSNFTSLVIASGLQGKLQQNLPSGLTVYVPLDSAFDALDANTYARLFETPDEAFIRDLVLYHIMAINQLNLQVGYEVARLMLNNATTWITNSNPSNLTNINDAAVVSGFIGANGYYRKIDKVLLPPNISEVLQVTSSVTALNVTRFISIVQDVAHLGDLFNSVVQGYPNLGNYYTSSDYLTVFAPVNSAFDQIDPVLYAHLLDPTWLLHLQSLCLNHFTVDIYQDSVGTYELSMLSRFDVSLEVLSMFSKDPELYVNETVGGVPIKRISGRLRNTLTATTGVIQIIGTVLLPPWTSQPVLDILSEVASEFVSLFQFSNLQSYVNSTVGPITVLAPTNEAIYRLGNQTGNATFVNELISRHIIVGNLYASMLNQSTAVSLANQTLQVVKISGNGTYIGGAFLVQADRLAANGVIHVIDRVL